MTVFSLGDDQAGGGTGPPVPSGSDSRLRDAGTAVPLCTSSAKQESVMTIEAMIEQPITLESCLAILRQLSPSHEARTNREPPSNAPQPQRSQNALIWHVKERHLMACPYLYCGRAPFTTNRGLVRHMLEHETMSPRSLPKILPKISTARQTSQAQHIAQLGSDIRIARMQLYFLEAESCDLLNEVLEARMNDVEDFKRHCRLRLAEETAKIKEDIVPFPVLWESSLLPFLCKFVTEWCGRGHSIGFVRGRSKDNKETLPPPRQICIMTREEWLWLGPW
ncbi:unnamed protein product [Parascedosporium putredinis]|uniref:C2H2-type domain-containing protein n=1 Tax=Parascedosporium putredinis TaxID=1442378 RepID=A0A9P1H4S5_9PEZI|nr:unnamed protein product [Parascedosporium putredinis]CAI7996239.1 unnamed protein product [Parascedosporium putredinis]